MAFNTVENIEESLNWTISCISIGWKIEYTKSTNYRSNYNMSVKFLNYLTIFCYLKIYLDSPLETCFSFSEIANGSLNYSHAN